MIRRSGKFRNTRRRRLLNVTKNRRGNTPRELEEYVMSKEDIEETKKIMGNSHIILSLNREPIPLWERITDFFWGIINKLK